MPKKKLPKKIQNMLFRVPNTDEGQQFIKLARKFLNPDMKLNVLCNGPRQAARMEDQKFCKDWRTGELILDKNGNPRLDQRAYTSYLPKKHATEFRVYLRVKLPELERTNDPDSPYKWFRVGELCTTGLMDIVRVFQKGRY
jgi:hypothetical protein